MSGEAERQPSVREEDGGGRDEDRDKEDGLGAQNGPEDAQVADGREPGPIDQEVADDPQSGQARDDDRSRECEAFTRHTRLNLDFPRRAGEPESRRVEEWDQIVMLRFAS